MQLQGKGRTRRFLDWKASQQLKAIVQHHLPDPTSQNYSYRNYLNERWGAHLIFYPSEGALIYGKQLKFNVHNIVYNSVQFNVYNKEGKYDLLNLEIFPECVCELPYYKRQRISDENSYFFIFTNYLNERLCRH